MPDSQNGYPHRHFCPSHCAVYTCDHGFGCSGGEVFECCKCMPATIAAFKAAKKKHAERFAKKANVIIEEHLAQFPKRKRVPLQKKAHKNLTSKIMSEMGRRGGKIGGKRRMESMTPEQRSALASLASRARWAKSREGD